MRHGRPQCGGGGGGGVVAIDIPGQQKKVSFFVKRDRTLVFWAAAP